MPVRYQGIVEAKSSAADTEVNSHECLPEGWGGGSRFPTGWAPSGDLRLVRSPRRDIETQCPSLDTACKTSCADAVALRVALTKICIGIRTEDRLRDRIGQWDRGAPPMYSLLTTCEGRWSVKSHLQHSALTVQYLGTLEFDWWTVIASVSSRVRLTLYSEGF